MAAVLSKTIFKVAVLFVVSSFVIVMLQLKMDTAMDNIRISYTGGFIHAASHQSRDEDAHSSRIS